NFTTGKVSCASAAMPLGPLTPTPLQGCRAQPPDAVLKTPADPVVMNSVVLGQFVKTIKVEKEVLGCDTPNGIFIGDVYLFTEVIEKRTATPSYTPFATRFEGFMCRKNPQLGVITGCARFTTT